MNSSIVPKMQKGQAGTAAIAPIGEPRPEVLCEEFTYCLLPSPLLRPSASGVDWLTFIMKYPLP
jgi:hypothetical protein